MNMKHEWMGVPEMLMKKLIINAGVIPVSYTHLDVYKRQAHWDVG